MLESLEILSVLSFNLQYCMSPRKLLLHLTCCFTEKKEVQSTKIHHLNIEILVAKFHTKLRIVMKQTIKQRKISGFGADHTDLLEFLGEHALKYLFTEGCCLE